LSKIYYKATSNYGDIIIKPTSAFLISFRDDLTIDITLLYLLHSYTKTVFIDCKKVTGYFSPIKSISNISGKSFKILSHNCVTICSMFELPPED